MRSVNRTWIGAGGLAVVVLLAGDIGDAAAHQTGHQTPLDREGQSNQEAPPPTGAAPLKNENVVALLAGGVSVDMVLRAIERSAAEFDLGAEALVALKNDGVSDEIIRAMERRMSPVDEVDDLPVLAALNARLSGGVIVSGGQLRVSEATEDAPASLQSPQFSEAASYLAFDSQPTWFVPTEVDSHGLKNLTFSLPLSVRLTSIAVAGVSQVSAPDPGFLKSQKAVQFQFGALADYRFTKFTLSSSDFHWGLGVIARQTFQSITDSQRAIRIWDLHDDLFEAYTLGLRLSLYQRPFEDGSAWRPAAYLDASFGRFENFETATPVPARETTARARACLDDAPSCFGAPPDEEAYKTTKKNRLYVEARLMLKYIFLGFDLNSGDGRDDARFIGGVTVTLDQFFKR